MKAATFSSPNNSFDGGSSRRFFNKTKLKFFHEFHQNCKPKESDYLFTMLNDDFSVEKTSLGMKSVPIGCPGIV